MKTLIRIYSIKFYVAAKCKVVSAQNSLYHIDANIQKCTSGMSPESACVSVISSVQYMQSTHKTYYIPIMLMPNVILIIHFNIT